VRLVYLDEAGTGNPAREPVVCVAGIIVNGDHQLNMLEKHISQIIKKHIPEDCREGFILHATHLFNGSGPVFDRRKPRLTEDEKWALADDLAALPRDLHLQIAVGWEFRAQFPRTLEFPRKLTTHETNLALLAVSFLGAASIVEGYMRKHHKNENCLMIMEDNAPARGLLRTIQNQHQIANYVGEIDEKARKFFPFRQIQEDPLFQAKRSPSGLELADFCAYVWKRYVRNTSDFFWRRFLDPMRRQFATY
jgi:hypothetical protein